MLSILDINNIAVTILGYPMSWIELIGTLFSLLSVFLVARRNVLNYPVGVIGTLLFAILFWQIALYADGFEQFGLGMLSIAGWYQWSKGEKDYEDRKVSVSWSPPRTLSIQILTIIVLSLFSGAVLTDVHNIAPVLFPEPAAFPYWDAFTSITSIAAMILMNMRRVENWVYWIVIDVIAVVLYWQKDVKLVSILYFVFLILATYGLIQWHRKTDGYKWNQMVRQIKAHTGRA